MGQGNILPVDNTPSWAHIAFEFFVLAKNWTHDYRGVNQIQNKVLIQGLEHEGNYHFKLGNSLVTETSSSEE